MTPQMWEVETASPSRHGVHRDQRRERNRGTRTRKSMAHALLTSRTACNAGESFPRFQLMIKSAEEGSGTNGRRMMRSTPWQENDHGTSATPEPASSL